MTCTKANIRSYCPNLYGGHRLFGMFRNSKIGQLEVWRKKEQQEEELQRQDEMKQMIHKRQDLGSIGMVMHGHQEKMISMLNALMVCRLGLAISEDEK